MAVTIDCTILEDAGSSDLSSVYLYVYNRVASYLENAA